MKTAKQWLGHYEWWPTFEANIQNDKTEFSTAYNAFYGSFNWAISPQGAEFWNTLGEVYGDRLGKKLYVVNLDEAEVIDETNAKRLAYTVFYDPFEFIEAFNKGHVDSSTDKVFIL